MPKSKKITIYTTTVCAYCPMVKKWLDVKGLGYDVVNLDEQPPELRQQVIEMSGAMTVPITVFGDTNDDDKEIVVGWNPARLAEVAKPLMS